MSNAKVSLWQPVDDAPCNGTAILGNTSWGEVYRVAWASGCWLDVDTTAPLEIVGWVPVPNVRTLWELLKSTNGNLSKAARLAGVPVEAVRHMLGIEETRGRRPASASSQNVKRLPYRERLAMRAAERREKEQRMVEVCERGSDPAAAAAECGVSESYVMLVLLRRGRADLIPT